MRSPARAPAPPRSAAPRARPGACACAVTVVLGCGAASGSDAHGSDDTGATASSGASTDASATSTGSSDGDPDTGAVDSSSGSDSGGVTGCTATEATGTALASGMAVQHRDGQTLVTWHDRAEGEAGAQLRYRLYRSSAPITSDDDLAALVPVADGVLNHSGQLFGSAFTPAQRLDTAAPRAVLEDLGEPLPAWSGLWAATTEIDDCAWYAVVATDLDGVAIESIIPGENATVDPIAERVAPRQPIKVYDSSARGEYSPNTEITGTPNLPLHVVLHGSQAQGGGAGDYGDYWLYFADATMGWQSGLPGVFSVEETHSGPQYLMMRNRDAIVLPSGDAALETMWFGYVAEPGGQRFAYPYTEARLSWMIPWVIERYGADPERVIVTGGSMGAWGTMTYAFRRPELFAAVFPDRPRLRQVSLTSVTDAASDADTLPDGTPWSTHHDSVAFATAHHEDLPFVGWNVGRQDGFAGWQEQIDMVAALTANHHGFAFAWNDGDHSGGSAAAAVVAMWYPPERFARNLGYPAFGNSSIDDDLGPGDPALGDLEGGINLGFHWTDPVEAPDGWSCDIGNDRATGAMTVDVTPRRSQQFSVRPGQSVAYSTTAGQAGAVDADAFGLVTVPQLQIPLGQTVTLTLTAQ